MRFALTEDQVAFRDAVRDLLAKECTPDVVRAAWTDSPGDRGLWDALVEMGVTSILVPESRGGLGLDAVCLVPILIEAGRFGLPHPLVETAMVAAPLVGDVGPMITVALGDGEVMPWADQADRFVVAHDSDGGTQLHYIGRDQLVIERQQTIDGARRLGVAVNVTLGATAFAGRSSRPRFEPTLVTDDPVVIDAARDRAALGTAAELVGLGERMLAMTVEHVKQRHQFGVPIGSFQAVKHHLANALKDLSFARPSVFAAAWALDAGAPTASRDISMAKALASDAALLAGRAALQCHGAIGYTVEYDLHLYMKRAWALARAHGDAARHRDRVGLALGV